MKPTKRNRSACAYNSLAARYENPESDAPMNGKLGFGSPVWATATSKPFGRAKPGELGCINTRMPECSGESLGATATCDPCIIIHPNNEPIVSNPGTPFDESRHAVKVAQTTIAVQSRLEKAFKGMVMRKRRRKPVKGQETPKETKVDIKDIPPNPNFKLRVPEFLTREEVRTDNGAVVPRCKVEVVEKVQWTPPSTGGRAGRIERWGE